MDPHALFEEDQACLPGIDIMEIPFLFRVRLGMMIPRALENLLGSNGGSTWWFDL